MLQTLKLLTLVILATTGCAKQEEPAPVTSEPSGDERPNIVVFLLDDTGYADLGAYGSEIETPNIDALAASGVRFTNYHTAATCSPTRSMLLTGADNHLTGMGNMIEIMADNQFDQPGYEGYMSNRVVTVATLLKDAGYHTYMAGKWHLGKTKDSLPAARGFERSVALMESGADNWEKKTYLPLYDFVHFYEGFEEIDLPDDFFSTDYYVDRIKEYIDKDRNDGKPFFAYVSLQAQHYPLQAPKEYIDKYDGVYDIGWDEIREQRYQRQIEMGIMPDGLEMRPIVYAEPWESLSEDERRMRAKQQAVYAGMLDNADANLGRLIDYLEEIGEADNTLIIVKSDNGADNNEQDKVFPEYYAANFDMSYEAMGLKGSYVNYGPGWAGASSAPLHFFKVSASEGGMRVPLIVHYPAGIQSGVTTDAFAYVTDITPTVLEVAGVSLPTESYDGREVHEITGKSMLSFLRGEEDRVHSPDDAVAYELAGSAAVFQGDYKLIRNGPPFGDKQWRLYNYTSDILELNDLADSESALFADMVAAYERYADEVNLIEVPDDYDVGVQLQKNAARNQAEEENGPGASTLLIMQKFIDKTLKPVLIIGGLGTAAAGVNAFFPRFAVENVQNLVFIPEYTIFVQHWGIMVCLMGVFMIAAAFRESWRTPILLYSLIEKAFMVIVVLSNLNAEFSRGFWAPAVMDTIIVLWSVIYFASLRNHAKTASP